MQIYINFSFFVVLALSIILTVTACVSTTVFYFNLALFKETKLTKQMALCDLCEKPR